MPSQRKKTRPYKRFSVSSSPDDLVEDTTAEERLKVLEICATLSKYCFGLFTAAGALSAFLCLQCFLGAEFFSLPQLKILSTIAIGFIGVVNIIGGLLLLASE